MSDERACPICGDRDGFFDRDGWTVHKCAALQDIQNETLTKLRYLATTEPPKDGTKEDH